MLNDVEWNVVKIQPCFGTLLWVALYPALTQVEPRVNYQPGMKSGSTRVDVQVYTTSMLQILMANVSYSQITTQPLVYVSAQSAELSC